MTKAIKLHLHNKNTPNETPIWIAVSQIKSVQPEPVSFRLADQVNRKRCIVTTNSDLMYEVNESPAEVLRLLGWWDE